MIQPLTAAIQKMSTVGMAGASPLAKLLYPTSEHHLKPTQPKAKSFMWGADGFARQAAITGGMTLAVAATLPALMVGVPMATTFTIAGAATAATALCLTGTLAGLWSATTLNNTSLLQQRSLKFMPCFTLGIAMGMLVGIEAALTMPGMVAMGTALLVLGYLTAVRTRLCEATLTAGVGLVAASIVIGPMGWLMAGGYGGHCALSAALCFAGAATSINALAYAILRMVQHSPPTALFDKEHVDDSVVQQARLQHVSAGTEPPTIFNVPEEFADLSRKLQSLKQQEGPIFTGYNGMCVATLYGPPGSGKTFSATGLAQSLGALYVAYDNATLHIDNVTSLPEAYMNLVTLLLEAHLKGIHENRPVVVLVDEVDALLPRANNKNNKEKYNDIHGVVLLTNVLSLLASGKTPVTLLMATNYPEKIAPLIARMSSRKPIFMGTPDRHSVSQIFSNMLNNLSHELDRRDVPHGVLAERPEMDGFIDRIFELNVTGRALKAIQTESLMRSRLRHEETVEEGLSPQKVIQAIDDAVVAGISDALEALETRGSQKQLNESYGRLTADETMADVDRLMDSMGLKNLNPLEIIRHISQELLGTYVNPSETAALSVLMSRFYVTVAQLGIVYAGNRFVKPVARDLTDVRPGAANDFFGKGNLLGMLRQICRDTLDDVWGRKHKSALRPG